MIDCSRPILSVAAVEVVISMAYFGNAAGLTGFILRIAVICPFSSSCFEIINGWVTTLRFFFSSSCKYRLLSVDDVGSKVTLITGVVELKNPKTRMNIIGKRKLKITAEGLLNMDRKLADAIAIIALNWLY
jgi:hypothetical protein